MTERDTSSEKWKARLNEAMYGIQDANIQGVSEIAGRTINRIRAGDLFTVDKPLQSRFTTPTAFDFTYAQNGNDVKFTGRILGDSDKLLVLPIQDVQKDLVRSLAIADQWPTNGFEDRMTDVYSRALTVQDTWITANNGAAPSTEQRATEVQSLLGEDWAFLDTGFTDWQSEIDQELRNYPPELEGILLSFRLDKMHFVSVRDQMIPHIYTSLAESKSIIRQDEDNRREFCSAMLFSSTLKAVLDIDIPASRINYFQ